jgi:Na+/proline symporter
MFGMDYQTALWVGAVATMAYVFIGGFLAVSWTDTIQASLMITALILAPLMVIYADGGVGASAAIIETARSGAFDMFKGQGRLPSSPCWPGVWATSASPTFWCASWRPSRSRPFPTRAASA